MEIPGVDIREPVEDVDAEVMLDENAPNSEASRRGRPPWFTRFRPFKKT